MIILDSFTKNYESFGKASALMSNFDLFQLKRTKRKKCRKFDFPEKRIRILRIFGGLESKFQFSNIIFIS
jgi:hypothetical protein